MLEHIDRSTGPRTQRKHTMTIEHVLAVVPVADFDAAHAWYELIWPARRQPANGRSPRRMAVDREWMAPSHLRPRPCRLSPEG